MQYASTLNSVVLIKFDGLEYIGKFGSDIVQNQTLPDGTAYGWTKRRDRMRGRRKPRVK